MDAATLDQIRAALRAELAAPLRTDRILTLEEAMAYTKHASKKAFYCWCARHRVTSVAPGRYAKSHLDTALDKETRKRRAPRPAPPRLNPPQRIHPEQAQRAEGQAAA